MATQLSSVASTLLPPTITGPIFAKAVRAVRGHVARPSSPAVRLGTDRDPRPHGRARRRVGLGRRRQARLPGRCRRQDDDRQEGRAARPGLAGSGDDQPGRPVLQLQQDLPTAIARAFDQAASTARTPAPAAPARSPTTSPRRPTRSRSAPPRRPPAACTTTSSTAWARSWTRTSTSPDSPPTRGSRSTRCSGRQHRSPPVRRQHPPGSPRSTGSTAAPSPASRSSYSARASPGSTGARVTASRPSPSTAPRPVARSCCPRAATRPRWPTTPPRATVQTAIQAWGGIYSAVTVSGSAGGPYTITFPQVASNVNAAAAPFAVNQTARTSPAAPLPRRRPPSRRPARAGPTPASAPSAATGRSAPTAWAWTSLQDQQRGVLLGRHHLALRVPGEPGSLLVEAYYGFVVGDKNAFQSRASPPIRSRLVRHARRGSSGGETGRVLPRPDSLPGTQPAPQSSPP
jgi:hypothetical protein